MTYKLIPSDEETHSYAEIGSLLVLVAHEPPTASSLAVASREALRMNQIHGSAFGLLVIVHRGSVPPGDLRKPMAEFLGSATRRGQGAALAILSDGFVASVQRSIATGFALASGHGKKIRVFSNCDEAVAWLASVVDRPNETMKWVNAAQRLLNDTSRDRAAQSATGS